MYVGLKHKVNRFLKSTSYGKSNSRLDRGNYFSATNGRVWSGTTINNYFYIRTKVN